MAVTVTIGGVAYTGRSRRGSLQITDDLDARPTAEVTLADTLSSLASTRPARGQAFALHRGATLVFAGILREPKNRIFPGNAWAEINLRAAGVSVELDRRRLTAAEARTVARLTTVAAQVSTLVGLVSGFTVGVTTGVTTPITDDIRFRTIFDVLSAIAGLNGAHLDVTHAKVVSLRTTGVSSGLTLATSDIERITYQPDFRHYRTHQTVVGGELRNSARLSIASQSATRYDLPTALRVDDVDLFALEAHADNAAADRGVRFAVVGEEAIHDEDGIEFFRAPQRRLLDIATNAQTVSATAAATATSAATDAETERGNAVTAANLVLAQDEDSISTAEMHLATARAAWLAADADRDRAVEIVPSADEAAIDTLGALVVDAQEASDRLTADYAGSSHATEAATAAAAAATSYNTAVANTNRAIAAAAAAQVVYRAATAYLHRIESDGYLTDATTQRDTAEAATTQSAADTAADEADRYSGLAEDRHTRACIQQSHAENAADVATAVLSSGASITVINTWLATARTNCDAAAELAAQIRTIAVEARERPRRRLLVIAERAETAAAAADTTATSAASDAEDERDAAVTDGNTALAQTQNSIPAAATASQAARGHQRAAYADRDGALELFPSAAQSSSGNIGAIVADGASASDQLAVEFPGSPQATAAATATTNASTHLDNAIDGLHEAVAAAAAAEVVHRAVVAFVFMLECLFYRTQATTQLSNAQNAATQSAADTAADEAERYSGLAEDRHTRSCIARETAQDAADVATAVLSSGSSITIITTWLARGIQYCETASELATDVRSLAGRTRTVADLHDLDIAGLSTDVGSLQSDVSSLQSDVSSLQSDVSSLQSSVSSLQSDVSSLQSSVSSLQSSVSSLDARVSALEAGAP